MAKRKENIGSKGGRTYGKKEFIIQVAGIVEVARFDKR